MWSELESLIEDRYGRARSPQPDDPESALALYGAFSNCHIAFERLEAYQSETCQADVVVAMDALLSTLHNLQSQLHLFDPDLATELRQYLQDEDRRIAEGDFTSRLRHQVQLLRRLVALQSNESDLRVHNADFSGARHRLADYIRSQWTTDELLGHL